MKNIFKKKDEKLNQDIQNMETELKSMETELKRFMLEKTKELNITIQKLQRIIKYSKDTPNFRITYVNNFSGFYNTRIYNLYLYINKEEYIISLAELEHVNIDYKNSTLKVENNIAYLDIISSISENNYTYKFIIDYEKGTYVAVKR